MTVQAIVEQNVRIALGDLHVQLIAANARIAELEQQLANLQQETMMETRPNGKVPEQEQDNDRSAH